MKNILTFELFEKRLEDRVVSAQDLIDSTDIDDVFNFNDYYSHLLGKPSKTFDMMIYSKPGGGKTTFCLKFAKYLAEYFGKVIYVSSEEFGSITLVSKLKKILNNDEEIPERLFFAKGMTDFTDYNFVFIDSLTDMDLELVDYKELRKIYPHTAFICVLQSTKSEDYKGGKNLEHEFEIAVEIRKGIATTFKNRYDQYGSIEIFTNKIVEDDEI